MSIPVLASTRYPNAAPTAKSAYRRRVQPLGGPNLVDTAMPNKRANACPTTVKSLPIAAMVTATASHQPIHAGRHRLGMAAVSVPNTPAAP